MSYVLGVDLGTTTVAAAVGDADRAEMVALGDRSVLAPAAVARRSDGTLVTGGSALRRAATAPDRVALGVRRRLGDPTPVLLGDRGVTPTDLLAALLRDAVDRAVAVRGDRPGRVVLTHPASWGPYRRGLFEDVAAAAGVADVVTVPDPVAAARHVTAVRGLADGTPLAVLDLGGASCEAAVVRDGAVLGVPAAVERLGGDDLDEAVAALVDERSGGLLRELDPEDPSSGPALARFRADATAAKEALSVDDEVVVGLLLPGRHVEVTLRRAALEERVAPLLDRAVAALHEAVGSSPVRPADLGAVVVVGGSARVPLLVRRVRAAIAAPVVVEAHPDHVVALGAVRVGAARGAAPVPDDDGSDGRTRLTPLRPHDPGEDRTTAVRLPPAPRPAARPPVPPRSGPPLPGAPGRPASGPWRGPGGPGRPPAPGPPSTPFRTPAGPVPAADPVRPARPSRRGRTVVLLLVALVVVAVLVGAAVALTGG